VEYVGEIYRGREDVVEVRGLVNGVLLRSRFLCTGGDTGDSTVPRGGLFDTALVEEVL